MFAEKNIRAGVLVGASLMLLSSVSQSALAQSTLQTPRGDQIVAPSQMPQQPTLNEDFANPSKINTRTVPGAASDMPGLPGIEPPGRKATQGPGMIMNADINAPKDMKPLTDESTSADTPRTGGIVQPSGIPSSVRIGPVEFVPMWQRAALGFWLTVQLVVLLVVAVTMTLLKHREETELNDGHMIHPDTTVASAPRGVADTL